MDYQALAGIYDEEIKVTLANDGAIKLVLDSDEGQVLISDEPRIGPKETIEEYNRITQKFGFFKNQEQAALSIQNRERFDAVIDTSTGSPSVLATQLLEKVELAQKTELQC